MHPGEEALPSVLPERLCEEAFFDWLRAGEPGFTSRGEIIHGYAHGEGKRISCMEG